MAKKISKAKTKKAAPKAKKAAAKPAKKKAGPKKAAQPVKKAPKVKKASARPSKTAAPAAAQGVQALPAEKQIVGGVLVGSVDDYFSHVGVMAIKLTAPLSVGDIIRIKGHTTDITQKVESMQVEHQPIQAASAGDAVGIHIADRARQGDAVYKI